MKKQPSKYTSAEKQANFGLNIFRHAFKRNGMNSLILSPLLISIDLAVIYNGATSDTAKQIVSVLAEGSSKAMINKYYSNLWKQLKSQKSLIYVNRWYIKDEIEILETYISIIKKYYAREIKSLNCNTNDIREMINNSIRAETENLITDIIPAGILKDDKITLMLINVMHFQDEFLTKFDPQGPYSTPKEFYVAEGDVRYVYMMETYGDTEYLYEAANNYNVLGIEYISGNTMFIVLPKERYGLIDVIESLNNTTLLKHAKNKKKKICEITMPRFEQNFHFDAKQTLKHLGITNAFKPSTAEFSNLTTNKSVYLQSIFHNASITVFENGGKSAFLYCRPSAPAIYTPRPDPEITFIADHPFLYFITDKNCNILLLGTVVDKFQPYHDNISYANRLRNPLNPDFFSQSIHG